MKRLLVLLLVLGIVLVAFVGCNPAAVVEDAVEDAVDAVEDAVDDATDVVEPGQYQGDRCGSPEITAADATGLPASGPNTGFGCSRR